MYRLLCADHGQERVLHQTSAALTLIGRAPNAALRLSADGVAERHALIERRANGYYICDLGSPAGVRVNHHPVADQRLVSGDEIELATMRFRFEVVFAAPKARAFDGLQLIAALAVAAVIVGEIVLVTWMFAHPRSRNMRKEIGKSVRQQPRGGDAGAALAAAGGGLAMATATVAEAPPLVLNRMLKIVRVERLDSTNNVSLRINVRAQVGERVLDLSAVRVGVQWMTRAENAAPVWHTPVWLTLPPGWENFSSKTLVAQWEGVPKQVQGGVVRTYYRERLQDMAVHPPSLGPIP